jgi:hypothetical protein
MPDVPDGLAAHLANHRFGGVTLIAAAELSAEQQRALPPWWREAAAITGPEAVAFAAAQWRQAVPGLFDDSLELFEERAVGMFIGRESSRPSASVVLVYALRAHPGSEDAFVCWYGYPPTDHLDNRTTASRPGVKADLTQVPEALRAFYTGIHNRFRVASADERGFVPLDELFTLDGEPDEFELIDNDGTTPAPETLLPIVTSGWGTLCLELGTERAWHQNDEMLRAAGDIGPALDSWIQAYCDPHTGDV